ncbi:MAG: peptidase domain-containing ABC transporter [Burkholderiales bacterium]
MPLTLLDRIIFGFNSKIPIILQTEASECGLACLGMIAGYYKYHVDLATLRHRFQISLKGISLASLIQIADKLDMGTRPVSLELEDLNQLKLPSILHWNFNHFVVLTKVHTNSITIIDPASGIRKLPLNEVSKSFTGVALELWTQPDFKPLEQRQVIKLRSLMGHVTGLAHSLTQILAFAFVLELLALISPLFLQLVIDNVLVSADQDLLTTLAIGFGLLMIMQQVFAFTRSWAIMFMSTVLSIQWRTNLFTHLLRLPVQYFEKRHLGDVMSRFGSIDQIQQTLTTSFLESILDGLMTTVTLIMMFIYNAQLAWISVSAMTLYGLSRLAVHQPIRNATAEQIIHAAKQQSFFLETIRGIKAIKLFQKQHERRVIWISLFINQINASLRTQRLQLFYTFTNGILFGAGNVLIIWLGAKSVLTGNITVGILVAFIAYKILFDSRVSALIDKFFDLRMLQLQGERLSDIVLTEPELVHNMDHDWNEIFQDTSVSVINLHYRYSEHEPYVLDNVTFKINAGEAVAIVGPSGCGKSTLMNILLGLLPPTEGDILIGNINIKQMGLDNLRTIIGTVLQDDTLFAGSIADNIAFFDPYADYQWVKHCAAMAGIAVEIEAMPMRYNSRIGDMGTILSGGQKQRILLARAFYKRPKILFLDEATSHLDSTKENEVNVAIKSLNITRIIIAHRQETIAMADRVITLVAGKIKSEP